MSNPSYRPSRTPAGEAQFKNFHKNLCERFHYVHDPIDWSRDQISLIEWIAKQHADMANEIKTMRKALSFYADPLRYQGPNQPPLAKDEFTPADFPYRIDVTRDNGEIARSSIKNMTSPNTENGVLPDSNQEKDQGNVFAWYVMRQAPGRPDHGLKLGPFWTRGEAEQWVDERHTLHSLCNCQQAPHSLNPELLDRLKQGRNSLGPDNLSSWDGDEREYPLAQALDQLIAWSEQQIGQN